MNKELLRGLRQCVKEAEIKYTDIIMDSNEKFSNIDMGEEIDDYDYYDEIILRERLKEIKNTKEELYQYIINNYGAIDNIYENGIQHVDTKFNKENREQTLQEAFEGRLTE